MIVRSYFLSTTLSLNVFTQAIAEDAEWQPLFDGKSLNGWHVKSKELEKTKGYWTVTEGAIVAKTPNDQHGSVWLVSDKQYANFELKLKVQSYQGSNGNSGVQIRSQYDTKSGDVNGPQVDIHPKGPWRTGFLWDQTKDVKSWLSPTQGAPASAKISHAPKDWKWSHAGTDNVWNDILIICNGTNIKTIINGVTSVDYNGAGVLDDATHKQLNVGLSGHIMLQLHKGQAIHLSFKDIYIKPLNAPE